MAGEFNIKFNYQLLHLSLQNLLGLLLTAIGSLQEVELLASIQSSSSDAWQRSIIKNLAEFFSFSIEEIFSKDEDIQLGYSVAVFAISMVLGYLQILNHNFRLGRAFKDKKLEFYYNMILTLILISWFVGSLVLTVSLASELDTQEFIQIYSNASNITANDDDNFTMDEYYFLFAMFGVVISIALLVINCLGGRFIKFKYPSKVKTLINRENRSSSRLEKLLVEVLLALAYIPLLGMLTASNVQKNYGLFVSTLIITTLVFCSLMSFSLYNHATKQNSNATIPKVPLRFRCSAIWCLNFLWKKKCSPMNETCITDTLLFCKCCSSPQKQYKPVRKSGLGKYSRVLDIFFLLVPLALLFPFLLVDANDEGQFEKADQETILIVAICVYTLYPVFLLVLFPCFAVCFMKLKRNEIWPYEDNNFARLGVSVGFDLLKLSFVVAEYILVKEDEVEESKTAVYLVVSATGIVLFFFISVYYYGFFHNLFCCLLSDLYCWAETRNQAKYNLVATNQEKSQLKDKPLFYTYASYKFNTFGLTDKLIVVLNTFLQMKRPNPNSCLSEYNYVCFESREACYKYFCGPDNDFRFTIDPEQADPEQADPEQAGPDPIESISFSFLASLASCIRTTTVASNVNREVLNFSDETFLSMIDILEGTLNYKYVKKFYLQKERKIDVYAAKLLVQLWEKALKWITTFQFSECTFQVSGFHVLTEYFKTKCQFITHIAFVTCGLSSEHFACLLEMFDYMKRIDEEQEVWSLISFSIINNKVKNFGESILNPYNIESDEYFRDDADCSLLMEIFENQEKFASLIQVSFENSYFNIPLMLRAVTQFFMARTYDNENDQSQLRIFLGKEDNLTIKDLTLSDLDELLFQLETNFRIAIFDFTFMSYDSLLPSKGSLVKHVSSLWISSLFIVLAIREKRNPIRFGAIPSEYTLEEAVALLQHYKASSVSKIAKKFGCYSLVNVPVPYNHNPNEELIEPTIEAIKFGKDNFLEKTYLYMGYLKTVLPLRGDQLRFFNRHYEADRFFPPNTTQQQNAVRTDVGNVTQDNNTEQTAVIETNPALPPVPSDLAVTPSTKTQEMNLKEL